MSRTRSLWSARTTPRSDTWAIASPSRSPRHPPEAESHHRLLDTMSEQMGGVGGGLRETVAHFNKVFVATKTEGSSATWSWESPRESSSLPRRDDA